MTPLLFSCYFDAAPNGMFGRLARVLRATAAEQCPQWDRRVQLFDAPVAPRRKYVDDAHLYNTEKLNLWTMAVDAAAVDTPILLIDADTAIVRPLDDVWRRPFDVALTVRDKSCRLPLNAGVVFLRANATTRAFMHAWRDANAHMMTDGEFLRPWRKKYGGLNQAALGYVLEKTAIGRATSIERLACQEWNCEDSSWTAFDGRTRIVHVKSSLRMAIFHYSPAWRDLKPLMRLWIELERQAVQS